MIIPSNKSGGTAPTGTISITENGIVDVTDYAEADVNVVDDRLDNLLNGTIEVIKTNTSFAFRVNGYLSLLSNLKKALLPNLQSGTVSQQTFNGCSALIVVDLGNAGRLNNTVFQGCLSLQHMVIRNSTMMTLYGVSSFGSSTSGTSSSTLRNGTGCNVYVPYDLVATYQTNSIWGALESVTFVSIQENLATLHGLDVDITNYYDIVDELPTSDISTTKVYLIETQTAGTYEQYFYYGTAWSTNLPNITL